MKNERSLAQALELSTPEFGSRYVPAARWHPRPTWDCRTCDVDVTDRYQHELWHRAEHWVNDVDKLYETVSLLFDERRST